MLKKIWDIAVTIVLVIMIIVAGVLLIPKLIGYETYTVLSGSMEPEFHVGSIVFVKSLTPDEISINEAISFKLSGQQGKIATHRVVEINTEDKYFITKGDANNFTDTNPVEFKDLIGRAEYSIPVLGYISVYMQTKQGMIIAVGVLVILGICNFLPKNFKK
ncbi:MAG: signal peptidase I [Clostridium sp.]